MQTTNPFMNNVRLTPSFYIQ